MNSKILYEVPEKRQRFVKHFQMENKEMVAAVYPSPVHFQEDGQWKDFDNRLDEVKRDGKTGFENRSSSVKVRFAKDAGEKELVSLKHKGMNLSWNLQGAGKVISQPVDVSEVSDSAHSVEKKGAKAFRKVEKEALRVEKFQSKEDENYHKQAKVSNWSSEGVYEDILPGVDLQYLIQGERIKENIHLKEKAAAGQELIFAFSHPGMEMVKEADGSLSLYRKDKKEEEAVFHLVRPYMYDANGNVSTNVSFEAVCEDGESQVKIKPDQAWLASEERTFPVVIDPMTETVNTRKNIKDTFIFSGGTDSLDQSTAYLMGSFAVGWSSAYGKSRAMIRFQDLPDLGKGTILYAAKMYLWQFYYSSYGATVIPIEAHEVTSPWDVKTVKWSDRNKINNEVLDYKLVAQVQSGNTITITPVGFDVTKLVRKWYNTDTNYGIQVKSYLEDYTVSSQRGYAMFYSSDNPRIDDAQYPGGMFYYRNVTGLEGHQSYHEQPAGKAGCGYTNDFMGNLTWVHPDLATKGGPLPTDVRHVFNTSESDAVSRMGYGWRLSCMQILKTTGNTEYPYCYFDEDGTKHYFIVDKDDGNKIKDEDGLGLVITALNWGSETAEKTMETKDKMKYIFGSDGYLRKIQDLDGNEINYTYEANSYGKLLTKVTDATDQELRFSYTEDVDKRNLTSITHVIPRETETGVEDIIIKTICYSYNSAGELAEIIYPDGKKTIFTYDDSHNLVSVTAPDGYQISYEYMNDFKVPRVSKVTERGSGGALGQEMKITYANGNTTIFEEPGLDGLLSSENAEDRKEADNKKTIYHFDNMGHVTGILEPDGFAANYEYYTSGMKNHKLGKDGSTQKTIFGLLKNHCFFRDGEWKTYNNGVIQDGTIPREDGYAGLKCAKLTKTVKASQEGICQSIKLPAGTYTLSAYLKTENLEAETTDPEGASLKIVRANGSQITSERRILSDTDPAIDNGWERLSMTFTLETAVTEEITVFCGMKGVSGNLYVTGVQLEEGNVANKLNLVENSHFKYDEIVEGVPDHWRFSANVTGTKIAYDTEKGFCAFVDGYFTQYRFMTQDVPVTGEEGDVYTLSCWVKGAAMPGQPFNIYAYVTYEDGTTEKHVVDCNPNIEGWQFVSKTFCVGKKHSDTKKKYIKLCPYTEWSLQYNDVYYKGMQLIRDDGDSYTYDKEGNLSGADSVAESSGFSHNQKGNMARMGNVDGTQFDYGYDTKEHLVRAGNSEGVRYLFTYDGKGQPLSMRAEGGSHLDAVTPGRLYYVRDKNSGNYLSVANASTADKAGIVLNDFAGTDSQKWKVTDCGEGYVYLEPKHAEGKRLDLKDASKENYAAVQILTKADADAQKWKLIPRSDGSYQIASKVTEEKKGLSNAGSVKTAGHAVTHATLGETYFNQWWFFEPADERYAESDPEAGGSASAAAGNEKIVALRVRYSGKYLTVKDGSAADGAELVQNYYTGEKHQQFRMIGTGGNNYLLEPLHAPGKVIADKPIDNLCLVDQSAQQVKKEFSFTRSSDGHYYTIWTKDGNFPVIGRASYDEGSRVECVDAYSDASQGQWVLEELTPYMETSMTYTKEGRQVATVTDARGFAVTYHYDEEERLLTSVTDAKNNSTSYTYDSEDRLTEVKKDVGEEEIKVTYTYENDRLKSITHNGFDYQFEYDPYGNRNCVKVADQELIETSYRDHNGLVDHITYATGEEIHNQYDDQEQLVSQTLKVPSANNDGMDETVLYTNTYDNYGNVVRHTDHRNNITTDCQFDMIGRVVGTDSSDGLKLRNQYDDKNRVEAVTQKIDDSLAKTEFLYGDVEKKQKPGLFYGLKVDGEERASYSYDPLARQTEKSIRYGSEEDDKFVTSYRFLPGPKAGTTTTILSELQNGTDTLSYTYDELGNIQTISENGILKCTYHYNELNSLVREDNVWENRTYCYTYDLGGNITSRKEYVYTEPEEPVGSAQLGQKSYGYREDGWKDQLISYNGQSIEYDTLGNPTTYLGMNFTWELGRQLKQVSKNGNIVSFSYDPAGNRIKKIAGGVETRYFWSGDKIIALRKGNELIHFIYDEKGNPFAMKVNNETYYYIYNGQNDVVGLIDSNGELVVIYEYNSWGLPLGITDTTGTDAASKNPFRYRGYCYDEETGFYYVSSRYYDPEICRFINADDIDVVTATLEELEDKNLYAYCDNNPIMRLDEDGEFWNVAAGAIMGGIISAGVELAFQALESRKTNKNIDWKSVGFAALGGMAGGALAATSAKAIFQVVGNAAISGLVETGNQWNSDTTIEKKILNVGAAIVIGGIAGGIGGDGIRVKGSSYGKATSSLKQAKKGLKKAAYRTKIKYHLAKKAVKTHRKKATIKTMFRYTLSAVFSSYANMKKRNSKKF